MAHSSRCKWAWMMVATALLELWPHSARALAESDKEAVRTLSNQAVEDFERSRFEEARSKFLSAYEIAKVPRLAVWAARADTKLGHWVAAYELYREAASLQPSDLWKGEAQQQAQKDAQHELNDLVPRIPRLTIVLEGAQPVSVAVSVDDVLVPGALMGVERMIDPGKHSIVGKRGADVVTESVQVAALEKKRVVLKFANVPGAAVAANTSVNTQNSSKDAPSNGISVVAAQAHPTTNNASSSGVPRSTHSGPQQTAGWVSLGVGAAGLALGTVTGIYLAAKDGSLESQCGSHNTCDASLQSEINTFNTMRTLSSLGFIVGGIGAATGVTLLLTNPKQGSKPNVALFLGPQMASVTGKF